MGSCLATPKEEKKRLPYLVNHATLKTAGYAADYEFNFKVIVVGDSGVGKSSIMVRFADNTFSESFLPTIGVDFKIRFLSIDNHDIKLSIWDTAGQERFRTITSSYYRGAFGVLIVYDVTNRQTYENVHKWLQDVTRYMQDDAPVVLVGNKADLTAARQVETSEAAALAKDLGISFFEVSAKDSSNVEELFTEFGRELVKRYDH